MSARGLKLESKIAEMRRAFDASFAAPAAVNFRTSQPLLAVRVAGESLAVRLADVLSLTKAKGIILPVPSSVPELLGLTGIRGTVVPVFSLAGLLGLKPSGSEARWLMLCGHKQGVIALAFEHFDRCLEVDASEIFSASSAAGARRYLQESIRDGGMLRAVIDVGSLLEHIGFRGALGAAR